MRTTTIDGKPSQAKHKTEKEITDALTSPAPSGAGTPGKEPKKIIRQ